MQFNQKTYIRHIQSPSGILTSYFLTNLAEFMDEFPDEGLWEKYKEPDWAKIEKDISKLEGYGTKIPSPIRYQPPSKI